MLLAFPEMKMRYDEEEMEHYNMERFADFTIEKINLSDWEALEKIFSFQEERIKFIDSRIENALNVSYCEALICSMKPDTSRIVLKYIGPLFLKFYKDYDKYYKNIYKEYRKSKRK